MQLVTSAVQLQAVAKYQLENLSVVLYVLRVPCASALG